VLFRSPPDLLYCKDTDGDEITDTREVIFTGFSYENVQGMTNSLRWGIDNWVHGATGTAGAQLRRPDQPESEALSLRGRDYKFHPETFELRATSGGGQHGMSFDRFGNKFVCHNSDHCQVIMYDDHYTALNPHYQMLPAKVSIASDGPAADVYRISPVEPWREVRTRLRVQGLVPGPIEGGGTAAGYFTSATGITVYNGGAYPVEYIGQVFIGDVGGNLIHRKTVRREGVEWIADRADEGTEFIRSTDIWFRPVQFAHGPDGCLYFADMYREVIEHPASLPPIIKQHLDLTSGNDRGRIYRIAPKGKKLSSTSPGRSAINIPHSIDWHIAVAARMMYENEDPGMQKNKPAEIVAELQTTWEQAVREFGVPTAINVMLRTLGLYDAFAIYDVEVLAFAMQSEIAAIRRVALSLAEHHPNTMAHALQLANDDDPRVRCQTALSAAYFPTEARIGPLAGILQRDARDKWIRSAVMLSAREAAPGVLALALDSEERPPASALAELAEQAGIWGSEATLAKLAQSLTEDDDRIREAIARGLTEHDKSQLLPLVTGEGGDLAQQMAARSVDDLSNADLDAERYTQAATTLAALDPEQAKTLFPRVLVSDAPDAAKVAVIRAMRGTTSEATTQLIASLPSASQSVRLAAVEFLFASDASVALLLDAIESEQLDDQLLDSNRWHQLLTHDDETIRGRAAGLRTIADVDLDAVYAEAIALQGDPARGKQLHQTNCAQCHQAGGEGYAVGPAFETLRESGPDKILSNVLWPNREINPQYINHIVETVDWETYSGIIESETAATLTLKRALGARDTLLKSDIESMESSQLSIMPEDWGLLLTPQDLADLTTFILNL